MKSHRVLKSCGKALSYGMTALFAVLLSASFGATTARAGGTDLKAYWDKGIRLSSEDKNIEIKLGGRVQMDGGWAWGNDKLEAAGGMMSDGFEIRRARLYIAAKLYEHTEGKFESDFAGNAVAIKDAYLALVDGPGGLGLRFGNFKEPFGLEALTSDKYVTFIERAMPVVFAPDRQLGAMIYTHDIMDGMATASAGVFKRTTGADGEYDFAGRITIAPILEDKGEKLVHLGISGLWREDPQDRGNDTIEFRERPEWHNTGRYIGTGTIPAKSLGQLGLEGAVTVGPVALSGEYTLAKVQGDPLGAGNEPLFKGYYGQISFFVTGEHRVYKGGEFQRVSPKTTAFIDGPGAIEIALRYSNLDLQDAADNTLATSAPTLPTGALYNSKEQNITIALNWHLNTNMMIRVNYIRSDFNGVINVGTAGADRTVANGGGAIQTVATRWQMDF